MKFASITNGIGCTRYCTGSILRNRRPWTLALSIVFGSVVFLAQSQFIETVAQQSTTGSVATQRVAPSQVTAEDKRYKIGAGDVLAVMVRKAPELSLEAVRVDQRGMIRLPMIDEDVQAACKTESDLSAQIATLYSEFKNNPSVDVFVRDFQSRPVAVIGAVNAPGQFRLQRQVRLLELLSFAGGPSEKAGRVINIIHTGGPNICEPPPSDGGIVDTVQGMGVLKLNDTLKGVDGANPLVQPGDIVSIPDADQVFVVGYVYSPRAISLKDKTITVSRAIAMAGGPQRDGKTNKVRIVRELGNGEKKQEIMVDLKAIEKQQAEDIALLPNDIVEVPSSTGRMIFNALTGAIAPTLANTSLRVIP